VKHSYFDPSGKNKKPAELLGFSGLELLKSAFSISYAFSGVHPRRRAVRVMMMAVMDVKLHHNQTTGA